MFHLASMEDGQEFFDKRLPGTPTVADEEQIFYREFGLGRGSLAQLIGPGAMIRGLGAALRGNFVGAPKGDPLIMPGAFVVAGRRLLWSHRASHSGDHPDFTAMARTMAEAQVTKTSSSESISPAASS